MPFIKSTIQIFPVLGVMENEENSSDPLTRIAKQYFGIDYLFPYQRLVISNILEAAGAEGFTNKPVRNPVTGENEINDNRRDQIVILPTGAGKSLCFMLPALFLKGVTIIVFPLLSLIADQARRLIESGITPGILRGGQSKGERTQLWEDIDKGKVKFILTNPETILKEKILKRLDTITVSHIVVDEVHTVSEWGDSFRPVYLELSRLTCRSSMVKTPVVTAFTATASDKILTRVCEIVFPGKSPAVIAANLDRPNIHYSVLHTISKNRQLIELLVGEKKQGCKYPVLIFSRSRSGAELTARMLREQLNRDNIFFYHAGLEREEKERVQEWFYNSTDGILTATIAYGMGIDKKNIRTVIHMEPSLSVEAYLQESGRAGRDKKSARAVVMVSKNDMPVNKPKGNQKEHTASEIRYKNFITSFFNTKKCRRESLLTLMGAEYNNCFGCDVCDKTVQTDRIGYSEIVNLIKKYLRKLTIREAALTLSGSRYLDAYEKRLFTLKGYNSLAGWTLNEIKDAVHNLETEGIIKIPRRGPYSNRLVFHRPKKTCLKDRDSNP